MNVHTLQAVAVIGAGGKMGRRVTEKLLGTDCELLLCEASDERRRELAAAGRTVLPLEQAVPRADAVVLAVPDRLIGAVSAAAVGLMKRSATMILLDPAAAYIGEVALRGDCSFVVVHPCHPALFSRQTTVEAMSDHFGGVAEQDLVMALHRGEPSDLQAAEALCRRIFAPVGICHRISVEQMAILEPATAEVAVGCALQIMREAMDEAVRRGVPEPAARSFVLGHMKVIAAVMFDQTEFPISDAAKVAVEIGREQLIRSDWKKIFEPQFLRQTVQRMVHGR